MSLSQLHPRTRQETQRTSLLRARDPADARAQEAAAADLVAALHPQRLFGNAALAGPPPDVASARTPGVATIINRTTPQVQTKLMLGPAHDPFEQEADAVAAQVVQRMDAARAVASGPAPTIQRQEEDEEELQAKRLTTPAASALPLVQRQEEEEEELQAMRAGSASTAGGELQPAVEAEINDARRGGSALSADVRSGMEQGFGADFGGVRVHTGQQADTLNRKLNARAFTTGRDIFFRQGEYAPASSSGQRLLAHELTHVLHQGAATQVQPKRAAGLDEAAGDPFFRS